MFGFIQKLFIGLLSGCISGRFDWSLASNSKGPIKCVSLNNRPCQARPKLVIMNSNEPLYYPFIVSVTKSDGSCNTIDDQYSPVELAK